MVVILASLLCALACLLGLYLVSRCCLRHQGGSDPPPKGLKKKAIDVLPVVSFGTTCAAPAFECVICLAGFAEGEDLRVLPRCGHGFHIVYVDVWLRTRATKPSCCASIAAWALEPAVVAPASGGGGGNDDTFLP